MDSDVTRMLSCPSEYSVPIRRCFASPPDAPVDVRLQLFQKQLHAEWYKGRTWHCPLQSFRVAAIVTPYPYVVGQAPTRRSWELAVDEPDEVKRAAGQPRMVVDKSSGAHRFPLMAMQLLPRACVVAEVVSIGSGGWESAPSHSSIVLAGKPDAPKLTAHGIQSFSGLEDPLRSVLVQGQKAQGTFVAALSVHKFLTLRSQQDLALRELLQRAPSDATAVWL